MSQCPEAVLVLHGQDFTSDLEIAVVVEQATPAYLVGQMRRSMDKYFTKFANATARITGSPGAFMGAVFLIVAWAVSGHFFGYSENWQLVINTGTTIVTFLMVFLIQNTQNRDSFALQTKLDELIRSSDAENEFMGIEKLSDAELEELHARCERSAERSQALLAKRKAQRSSIET